MKTANKFMTRILLATLLTLGLVLELPTAQNAGQSIA